MRPLSTLPVAALAGAALTACATMPANGGAGGSVGDRRIVLTDRRGERWDITHAVNVYGMDRAWWEFGIGKNAIPPLDEPRQIKSDHPRYPSPYQRGMRVIGTTLGGEARSYPQHLLRRHEIVNESFGQLQAAVAY